jgi:CubicO group peptidase (beta-lactamase class C family)
MRTSIIFVFICCQLIIFEVKAQNSNPDLSVQSTFLDKQMHDLMEKDHLPNAVITMVSPHSINFIKGYGHASIEAGINVDPHIHLFRIGSVSKLFTWIAVMQLHEKGLVDLDEDIDVYLDIPLKSQKLYKSETDAPVTLRHLLSHTAGYEDVIRNLMSFKGQLSLRDYLLKYDPARIFPPGTVMGYSNYGTILAGYIVEVISGMPYKSYIRDNIFLPLGMQMSSFEQPLQGEHLTHLVTPYRSINGQFLSGNFEHMPAPAGGMSTTAFDMALFMQAILNQGANHYGRVLSAETMQLMHSMLRQYHPQVAGMAYGFMKGTINGQTLLQHGGSTSVFDAGLYLLPENETGIFIAYSGGNYAGHIKIFRKFMDEFYPVIPGVQFYQAGLVVPSAANLSGEYHQSRMFKSTSDKLMNLFIGSLRLKSLSEGIIDFTLYDMNFSFRQEEPGIYKTLAPNTGYPFGSMEYLVFGETHDGRLMLITDGPMTYIKARWYETSSFAMMILLPAILLAVGTLLFFIVRSIYMRIRSRKNVMQELYVFVFHSIMLLGFIAVTLTSNAPHPVHLLPASFFDAQPLADFMNMIMPVIVAAAGILVAYFTVRYFRAADTSLFLRIYSALYCVFAVALIWFFWFYNMIL